MATATATRPKSEAKATIRLFDNSTIKRRVTNIFSENGRSIGVIRMGGGVRRVTRSNRAKVWNID